MLSLSEVLQDRFLKADEGDPSPLVELGLTLPLIREIQNAPLKKRNHFCKLSGMYLGKVLHQELSTVSCQKRLKEILLYVDREDPDDWRLDELLRQGATATLMRDAFGISKDEFTVRRKLLKVSDAGGRPRQITRHQEAAILKSWSQSYGPRWDYRKPAAARARNGPHAWVPGWNRLPPPVSRHDRRGSVGLLYRARSGDPREAWRDRPRRGIGDD